MVAVGEALENAIDLLCFFGEFYLHKQLADSHVDGIPEKGKFAHVTSQHGKQEGIFGFGQVASDGALADVVLLHALQVVSWRFTLLSFRHDQSFPTDVERVLMGHETGGAHPTESG